MAKKRNRNKARRENSRGSGDEATAKVDNGTAVEESAVLVENKNNQENGQSGGVETWLVETEEDGEACLDIECGNNVAKLFTAKLSLGSKGSCVLWNSSWMTPNEFQLVSGRETAKDWKRSIRHNGRCLKLLIGKGLITVKCPSPKKSSSEATEKKENDAEIAVETGVENDTIKSPDNKLDKVTAKEANVAATDGHTDEEVPVEFTTYTRPKRTKNVNKAGQAKIEAHLQAIKQKTAGEKSKKKRKFKKGKRGKSQQLPKPRVTEPEVLTQDENTTEYEPEVLVSNANKRGTLPDDGEDGDNHIRSTTAALDPEEACPEVEDEIAAEQKRLEEFVKSLRLSRTKAKAESTTTTTAAPELPVMEIHESAPNPAEAVEVEMPTLQKENEILVMAPAGDTMNTYPSAVTPPPTPPSSSPNIDEMKRDLTLKINVDNDIFKSRLSPLDEGLKLTINRAKLPHEPTGTMKCDNEMQAYLLQDALKSAKKYKEQMLQKKRLSSDGTPEIIDILQPEVKREFKYYPETTATTATTAEPSYQSFTEHYTSANLDTKSNILQQTGVKEKDKGIRATHPQFTSHIQHSRGVKPTGCLQSDARALSHGVQCLQGLHQSRDKQIADVTKELRVVQTAYGPMYLPKDAKLGLQPQMMLPGFPIFPGPNMHSGLPTPPSPKDNALQFPNPLLLAQMGFPIPPQFLNNIYQHPSFQTNTSRDKNNKSNDRTASDDNNRKRKQSECDGALDLSIKKVRNNEYKPKTDRAHVITHTPRGDIPIDYSVKRQQACHKQTDAHSDISRLVPTPQSVHAQSAQNGYRTKHVNHSSDAWTNSANVYTKGLPTSCTCGQANNEEDVRLWSVDRVCSFLTYIDGCSQYSKTFREQGISGRLLPFLTTQHLTRTLGMKVGPALALMQAVERKFRENVASNPCSYCRSRTNALLSERSFMTKT